MFRALDALLIERMRDSIAKSPKSLQDLMSRFDANHDGALEFNEVESMFLECQIAFKPQMFARICSEIFDVTKQKRPTTKVSYATLKHFLAPDNHAAQPNAAVMSNTMSSTTMNMGASQARGGAISNYDLEPQRDLGNDTSPEELALCRSGARKILNTFQASIVEVLNQHDKYQEGLISREKLEKAIENQKVADLNPAELNLLMKYSDRGSKGYIAIDRFIERLQELAT